MVYTLKCLKCNEYFKYFGMTPHSKKYCNDCVANIKIITRPLYELSAVRNICPICNRASVKHGRKIHLQCEKKQKPTEKNIDRDYWKEHVQKGVVDDEMSVLI